MNCSFVLTNSLGLVRRCFLHTFAVLGWLVTTFFASLSAAVSEKDQPPNYLIISIDDLNDWVGCLGGHPQAWTPHIDQLAERGVLFTNAHCQAPICTPSRASLLTGKLPSQTGLYFLQPGLPARPETRNLPTILSELARLGYTTMGAGKFVSGGDESAYFKEFGGSFGGFGPNPEEKINCDQGGPNWDWGKYPDKDADLPDYDVTEWVCEKLGEDMEAPFILVAGFYRPHVPLYVPEKWYRPFPLDEVILPKTQDNDLEDISEYALTLTEGLPAPRHDWFLEKGNWSDVVQAYLASVAFVDHCVGQVLSQLRESEHADNTVVILLSDHGWHLGEKARWAKRSLWSDSTRVPLIFAGKNIPQGKICAEPAGLVDIFPTMLELAGQSDDSTLNLCGTSLTGQLQDPTRPRKQPAICEFGPGNVSLHFRDWHLIRYHDGSEELYHIHRDPHEWNNLAGSPEYAALLSKLREHIPADPKPPILAPHWNRWEVEAWRKAEQLLSK